MGSASIELSIFVIRHGFQPRIGAAFTGYLHGQVREPAVGSRAVPVLYTGGDVDHVAGLERLRWLSPGLVPATAGHAEENLPAALLGVVDVPVVPAAWLKGHVINANLAGGEGLEIALPHKILGEAVVGCTDGEDHFLLVKRLGVCCAVLRPNLLGHAEGRPRLRPTGIKGGVGENFRNFLPGDTVLLGGGQVVLEGAVHQPLRHHRHQGAILQRELVLPAQISPKSTSSLSWANLGAKVPRASRPAVCFTAIFTPPDGNIAGKTAEFYQRE